MHELLPFYERELALLQQQAERFAQRHPHRAGQLSASGELLQDPQVQRLMQGFALLASRIHARLEPDVPELTRPLLEQLCPQWLRPLPSCSIAQFDNPAAAAALSAAQVLPAGTLLDGGLPEQDGLRCRFATTAPVQLLPVRVAWAGYSGALSLPAGTRGPRGATALLSLRLELLGEQARWDRLGVDHVRLFLDADPALATLLREALTGRVAATLVQVDDHSPWHADPAALPRAVGLDDADALLGTDPGWPPAQRLVAEYFAFPPKFDFIDLPLPAAAQRAPQGALGLHFALAGPRGDGAAQQLLEQVHAQHWRTGCVPVVNLFPTTAQAREQPRRPGVFSLQPQPGARCEVHAVTRVQCSARVGEAEVALPLRPWCSLEADDVAPVPDAAAALLPPGGLFWSARRGEAATRPLGDGALELALVDSAGRPAPVPGATLVAEVRATDGALPAQRAWDAAGARLCLAEGGGWNGVRLLRRPTPPRPPVLAAANVWHVVSLLSSKSLALGSAGLDALKDTLRLLDLARGPHTEPMLQGLADLACRPVQAWMSYPEGALLVRGTELQLAVHEAAFAPRGLRLFALVLSRWFAQYVHINSFIKLKLVSATDGALLVECPRRDGDVPLV